MEMIIDTFTLAGAIVAAATTAAIVWFSIRCCRKNS